jgi:hypothetical protein
MVPEKFRVVPDDVIIEASEEYKNTFDEDASAENVAKRFYELVPPRWLIASMRFPRPEAGSASTLFFLSALLTHELEPSRWRRSGINDAQPFLFYLLRGRRREQVDAIKEDWSPKATAAVQLITAKAKAARHGLNGPVKRPLFAVHSRYTQWHFYASLWYGRELVPTDWFVAKSYRATCWGLWQDGFPQGDTGDVWGDKLRPIAGGLE